MDCTICGKSTLPGAMLCAPCKAALKRARYVTVQEDMRRPSVIDARRMARRARPAATPTPAVTAPTPRIPVAPPSPVAMGASAAPNAGFGRRIFVGIAIVAAALSGASYFGLHELGARSRGDAGVAPAVAGVRDETPAPVIAPPPAAPVVVVPAPAALPVAEPPSKPVVKPAVVAKRATPPAGPTFTMDNVDPATLVPPPVPEPVAVPAPPPPRPAPDRWQTMRDALAECDRQGVFDGLICGQRVRIQYCEGYWGKVPQCPGMTANPER